MAVIIPDKIDFEKKNTVLPEVKRNEKGDKTNISVYVPNNSLKMYEAKINKL